MFCIQKIFAGIERWNLNKEIFLDPVDREWLINLVDTAISYRGLEGRKNLLRACNLSDKTINTINFNQGSRNVAEDMVGLVERRDNLDLEFHYLEDLLRYLIETEAYVEPHIRTKIEDLLINYNEVRGKTSKSKVRYKVRYPVGSNPSSSNLRLTLYFLLAVIIVILIFFPYFVNNPRLIIGVALLGILIISILFSLVQTLATSFSYRRYYYDYLYDQHRDFDIKGLRTQSSHTLDLEQVFVELSIDPKPFHQVSPDPLQIPEPLRTGRHIIWDYLASKKLAKQHFVVIGPPGSGKTTLLKHITLTLIAKKRHHRLMKIPHKLPILLFLRDYVNMLKDDTNFSLLDAVEALFKKSNRNISPNWVEHQLADGRCLVMLDGLDEVADPVIREKVVQWVEQQKDIYAKNRFIVTSRPFGYRSNPLSRVTLLQVRSFTFNQLKQFVHNWYKAQEIMSAQRNDHFIQKRAEKNAEYLLRQLHNTPAILQLAVNPLLLTMIATVHRFGGSLPDKRVALYAEICAVFLGERQRARGITSKFSSFEKQSILQPLAYAMMCKEIREITFSEAQKVIQEPLIRLNTKMSAKVFLQMIEDTSGIVLEREDGVYSFAHLSLQEYLAATHVRENHLVADLMAQVGASWWQETIRLYCSQEQADANSIIMACLAENHLSIVTLSLALECQKEAVKIQPEVNALLNALIDQSVEDGDQEKRIIAAKALLARRVNQMIPIEGEKETYTDTSLISCAEYQVFLDEQRVYGAHLQPDHWTDHQFFASQGRTTLLGIRPSDASAFCEWLTQLEQGVWRFRLPRVDELKNTEGEERGLVRLTADSGYWLEEGQGIGWAKEVSPLLKDKIRNQLFLIHYRIDSIANFRSLHRDQLKSLKSAIERVHDLIEKQKHDSATLKLIEIRNMALIIARDFEQVNFHLRNHALGLAVDFDLIRSYIRHRHGALNLDRMSSYATLISNNRITANSPEYLFAKTLADRLHNDLGQALNRAHKDRIPIINRVSALALDLIDHLNYIRFQQVDDVIQSYIDDYLDVFMSIAILEERIQGTIPAREGILIIKERRTES